MLLCVGLTYSQSYEATINQSHVGSYLYVSLYLRHTGTTAPVLGFSSFYIDYNNVALSSPTLSSEGQWDGLHHTGYGSNVVNSNHSLGIASIEVIKSGTPTYQIPNSTTLLGIIRFTIDPAHTDQNSEIQWNNTWCEVNDVNNDPIKGDGTFTDPVDFSLPVQMSDIQAESTVEGIELTWITQSEVNSAGFHVWRSDTEEGEYTRMTTSLISSMGNNSSGSEYKFTDANVESSQTFYYKIEELGSDGSSQEFGPIQVEAMIIPEVFALKQNYPNPFNPTTTISYDVPEVADVTIKVFSLLGKEVKTLYNKQQLPGRYTETWDGSDNTGRKLASGVYFLRMHADDFVQIRKMTLIR